MKKHALIILSLILIFWGRDLFVFDTEFIGGIEVKDYFFWNYQFIKEQMLAGHFPLWNPYYFSGQPFLANPQTAVLYPLTSLFVVFPLAWAFNLDIVLHLCIAAGGMYTFVFLLSRSRSAALCSAVTFCFCGYFMYRILAGHLITFHAVALLPWIFTCLELALRYGRLKYYVLTALVLGLQILAGEPQTSFYSVLAMVLYYAVRFAIEAPTSDRMMNQKRVFYFVLVFVFAVLLSFAQILPSLEFYLQCDRSQKSLDFSGFMSFDWNNFLMFLVPAPPTMEININWEFGYYAGILALILSAAGLTYDKFRKYNRAFLIILGVAIILALGTNTALYQFLFKVIPGFSFFRIPARAMFMASFILAIGAGLGAARFFDNAVSNRSHVLLQGLLATFLIVLLAASRIYDLDLLDWNMRKAICLVLLAWLIVILAHKPLDPRIKLGLILFGLFLDPFVNFAHDLPKLSEKALNKPTFYEKIFAEDTGFYRVVLPKDTMRAMKFKFFGLNGHAPIVTENYFEFVHAMADLPTPSLKRSSFGAGLLRDNSIFSSKILGAKYALISLTENGRKDEVLIQAATSVERAYLAQHVREIPDINDQLGIIKDDAFDPRSLTLLESLAPSHHSLTSEPASFLNNADAVTITNYMPGRIELNSIAPELTYLVLNEPYYPGWRATVDGKKSSITRANYLLTALPLPVGVHSIVFEYKPASFLIGSTVSLTTLLFMGLYLLIPIIKLKGKL